MPHGGRELSGCDALMLRARPWCKTRLWRVPFMRYAEGVQHAAPKSLELGELVALDQ
jgi:hypothetical protein